METCLHGLAIPSASDFLNETIEQKAVRPHIFDLDRVVRNISSTIAKTYKTLDTEIHFYAGLSDQRFSSHLSSTARVIQEPFTGDTEPSHLYNISGCYHANIRSLWASDRLGDWMDRHGAIIGDIYHMIKLEQSPDDYVVHEKLEVRMWPNKGFPKCFVELQSEYGLDREEEYFKLKRRDLYPRSERFSGDISLRFPIFWKEVDKEVSDLPTREFLKGKALTSFPCNMIKDSDDDASGSDAVYSEND